MARVVVVRGGRSCRQADDRKEKFRSNISTFVGDRKTSMFFDQLEQTRLINVSKNEESTQSGI